MFYYFPHRHKKNKNSKQKHVLDVLIYPIALISPIMTIPQLSDIWVHKNIVGVSFITWASYSLVSGFWFMYGVHHKEKPIIISSGLLFILQFLIVIGIVYK